MPSIPTQSPVTGAPLSAHYIHTTGSHFVDQSSRVRILRGVNLCASSPNEFSFPLPRQGKDDSAKARRREAYKSGISFVSLYELYSDPPPPPIPVPPIPALDRSRFTAEAGSVRRARSSSTTSAGGSRERKGSIRGNASPAPTKPLHIRARSGSTGNSQPKPQNSANRVPAVGDGGGPLDSPNLKGLANSTMSSSVTLVSSSNSNLTEGPRGKSKRQHVLLELLETERIYSSDMALVKAVHLPLALGLKIDFGPMGSTTSARSSALTELRDLYEYGQLNTVTIRLQRSSCAIWRRNRGPHVYR